MTFDVAVIGAGPAGCSAAMSLCKRGYSVALLDRATFPRDKACGEFINPGACKLIQEVFDISFAGLLEVGGNPVSQVALQLADGPLEVPIVDEKGKSSPGVSLRRMCFDELLVSKCRQAGVHVFLGHKVQLVERGFDRLYVRGIQNHEPFLIESKMVFGADGTHSATARREGLTRPIPRLNAIGIVFHFDNVCEASDNNSVIMFPATGERMLFGFSRQHGQTAVLSGSVPTHFARTIAADAEGFARRYIAHQPQLAHMLQHAKITQVTTAPCFGHRLVRSFADRMLFLGDAACFIDPFSGEGIHHAIESGLLADETAEWAFARGAFGADTLSHYEHLRSGLRARYRLCDVTQAICSKPWLIDFIGKRLKRRPTSAGQLISAITDLTDARTVLRSSFALKLLMPTFENAPIKRQRTFVRNAEQAPK